MKSSLCLLILVTLLASAAIADPTASDLQKQNAQLRARIEQLQNENATLRAQLDALHAKTTELQQRATAMEREQVQQQKQLRELFLATDYDEAANRTTLFTTAMKLKMLRGSGSDHWLTISTAYPGKELSAAPDHLTVSLSAWFAGDLYRTAKSITLDIDGQTVECPITDYQVQRRVVRAVKKTIDRSDAIITAQIPMSAVRAIGDAGKVTGSIAYVQFQFPREVNEACKALSQALPK